MRRKDRENYSRLRKDISLNLTSFKIVRDKNSILIKSVDRLKEKEKKRKIKEKRIQVEHYRTIAKNFQFR